MKVVLDANFLVAAFASRGPCEDVVELCLENHEIVVSEPPLLEVQGNLKSKFRLPDQITAEIVDLLRTHSKLVEPNDVASDACRDRDDLMVLGTAKAAGANCIVTGDRDLLALDASEDILIWKPRKFWESESRGGNRTSGAGGEI